MPQSLSLVVIHVIFSTKEHRPFLDPDTRPNLHAYLATVARNAACECYRAGGVADHVHLAIRLSWEEQGHISQFNKSNQAGIPGCQIVRCDANSFH